MNFWWPGQTVSPRLAVTLLAVILGMTACSEAEEQAIETSDFNVLAQQAQGYVQAVPGKKLEFPRDHGAHPGYRIEWWYVTANLEDDDGQQYGAQWTLFRFQTRPNHEAAEANAWQSAQLFMGHFAITTPGDHRAWQRYARGGLHGDIAQAGVRAEPFAAWLDDWTLHSSEDAWLPLEVSASAGDDAISLKLHATGPLILQGEGGFSQKHPEGGGSYYYSQPFLEATGSLTSNGEVIEVSGVAWIDREWSSQFLQADQSGWDWFSIHLDSGEKLMLFRLRSSEGTGAAGDFRHGVLLAPDGTRLELDPNEIHMEPLEHEPVAERQLPLRWRIDLPEIGREMEVDALYADQWMDLDYPYWEGVINVTGSNPGSRGRGYLEMTGY